MNIIQIKNPQISLPLAPLSFHISQPQQHQPRQKSNHPTILSQQDEYIAICLSVKDQSRDLPEFLTHHYHHHAIRPFYIMDDGSSPPLSTFTYPGLPRSALTFTWQNRTMRAGPMQLVFYNRCLERYAARHTWIAILDADEYIETPGPETFREVLESFEHNRSVGALGINWKVHTSSGLKTRPSSSRKAFTSCAFDGNGTINQYIKSVVKTSFGATAANPHKFRFAGKAVTVG